MRFKVPDATVQKFLPERWQASPDSSGPSKDANQNVVFVDVFAAQSPDCKPEDPYRVAAVVITAKKQGTEATVPMVVTGFASIPGLCSGAFCQRRSIPKVKWAQRPRTAKFCSVNASMSR